MPATRITLDSFTTPRLVAERLTPAHLPDVRRMDGDQRYMELLGGTRDEAATAAYMERNLSHWDRYGFGLWMLRERDGCELIGRAVLRHLDVEGADEVEIGYGFYPEFWRRGLATEVACACVSIGRSRLGLSSLVAITRPENAASRRVMAKAGLAYEREILCDGVPHVLFRTRGT